MNNTRKNITMIVGALVLQLWAVSLFATTSDHVDNTPTNNSISINASSEKNPTSSWEIFTHFMYGSTPSNGIFLGMWSYHYMHSRPFYHVNWHNYMVGMNYKSFFFGTFINSENRQSLFIGIRRNLWHRQIGNWNLQAGYNVGLIYGYRNGNGFFISKWSPVIPAPQVYFDATYYHVGIEVAMVPSVATVGFKVDL